MTDYLGFDLSTQQIKAVIIGPDLKVKHTYSIQFETELPHYKTTGGVHVSGVDGAVVTSPVLMWLEAVDALLAKMLAAGVQFNSVLAVSGAGQQHGSVYWNGQAQEALQQLDPKKPLKENLKDSFARLDSPVWMDSSTGVQCQRLEAAVGGPLALAQITGSQAQHRFTGPQIAKIYDNEPEIYDKTERISLVSSFACSLLLGAFAPIDYADGSGMNLFDIVQRRLHATCVDACAPRLTEKLGGFVPACQRLGKVCGYFVERYGFNPDCEVIAFTGDNPATLAGLNMRSGDVAISWGTSDTVMLSAKQPKAVLNAAVFCNPVETDAFMCLLCFKNGAFTRARVCKSCECADWVEFNRLLQESPPGNNGNIGKLIGMFYNFPEILPVVPAVDHRFNAKDEIQQEKFPRSVEARAVIEHQCLAKRVHTERLGLDYDESSNGGRLLVTGGASVNSAFMQVLADVFGRSVYVQDIANAAALGSAYRAKHAISDGKTFADVVANAGNFTLACEPRIQYKKTYDDMTKRYALLETKITKSI